MATDPYFLQLYRYKVLDLRFIAVIHDETLDRTTNGKGPVTDITVKELKTLLANNNFSDV